MAAGQGRRIRLGAVLVAVVLSLTGFSANGGSHGKGDSGGGGCSSSKSGKTKKKSQGGGIHTDTGPAGSAAPTATASTGPATATVVSCVDADASHPSSTIEVTSRLDRTATFSVTLRREGVGGGLVETATARVTLEPRETRTQVVPLRSAARAADVRDCRITEVLLEAGTPSPSPSATP